MKNLLVVLALLLPASLAQAQILKCVGAGGRIEFAASCPPGTKAEATGIRNNPAPASSGSQKSLTERDADFRKRQVEQQEAAKKADEKSRESADRALNCENAQSYMRSLQSGVRVARTDPKTGERVFMDDTARAAEIERAQRAVETNCN